MVLAAYVEVAAAVITYGLKPPLVYVIIELVSVEARTYPVKAVYPSSAVVTVDVAEPLPSVKDACAPATGAAKEFKTKARVLKYKLILPMPLMVVEAKPKEVFLTLLSLSLPLNTSSPAENNSVLSLTELFTDDVANQMLYPLLVEVTFAAVQLVDVANLIPAFDAPAFCTSRLLTVQLLSPSIVMALLPTPPFIMVAAPTPVRVISLFATDVLAMVMPEYVPAAK